MHMPWPLQPCGHTGWSHFGPDQAALHTQVAVTLTGQGNSMGGPTVAASKHLPFWPLQSSNRRQATIRAEGSAGAQFPVPVAMRMEKHASSRARGPEKAELGVGQPTASGREVGMTCLIYNNVSCNGKLTVGDPNFLTHSFTLSVPQPESDSGESTRGVAGSTLIPRARRRHHGHDIAIFDSQCGAH